jgi:hypothetical protein
MINKPIIICTFSYDPGIGGIKVLHKLCYLLNKNGCESYLMPLHYGNDFYTYEDYNKDGGSTPLITQEILDDLDNCVVVYPDCVDYNPLNAKNVVRWLLAYPDTHMETYSDSDLIFWFSDYYYNEYLGQRENQLQLFEFHNDIFYNQEKKRKGSCYSVRKCEEPKFIHPEDSITIPYSTAGHLEYLADVFNATIKFYCYDNYTFLPIQAAMCGCVPIVVPDPNRNKTKEQWMDGFPLHKYGIAYGEDDLPRAIKTLPLLVEEIKKINLESQNQIVKFINKIRERFDK